MHPKMRKAMPVLFDSRSLLPYSLDFSALADGALPSGWTGSTWAISSGVAVNTPTLGAELVTNGNFATWSGDNPSNWTLLGGPEAAGYYVTENPAGQAQIVSDGTYFGIFKNAILTLGAWYQLSVDIKAVAAGSLIFALGGGNTTITAGTTGVKLATRRASGSDTHLYINRLSGATDVTIDDVTMKAITAAAMFATRNFGQANVSVGVDATITAGTQAGVIVSLDSASSPQNFVLAYHDGTNAHLVKCVGGTYAAEAINTAATYAAGAEIKVTKSGTSYALFYNDVQIGTTQTISDVGIINNTLHGMFSTYGGNSLDSFFAQPAQ